MITIALLAGLAGTAPPPELQPWAMFVGHCWSGDAPVPKGVDTHCFEAVYGGQHIRDRHEVKIDGKTVYAGETIYSAKGPRIIFTYWNSLGGLGTGEALVAGNEWQFSGTIHATATSAEQPMAAVWKLVPGGYEAREGSATPRLFKRVD